MAIDPNDFDVPVKDYSFNEVTSTTSLIDQMAQAGVTKVDTQAEIVQAIFGFDADHNRKSR